MTADELHKALEDDRGRGEVLGLAGKLSEEAQLYLISEVLRVRSLLRGLCQTIMYEGSEVDAKSHEGPWFTCTECDAKWLDPHNPPPETEDTCGHSVPT